MGKRRHWEKPLSTQLNPCLNCSPIYDRFKLNGALAVGFGLVSVKCNNKTVWCGDDLKVTLQCFENKARKWKKGDWRLKIDGPLYDAEYQRQGRNNWILIKKGLGFA